eukprot:30720-Alexandrium_andersonii.AAC.1
MRIRAPEASREARRLQLPPLEIGAARFPFCRGVLFCTLRENGVCLELSVPTVAIAKRNDRAQSQHHFGCPAYENPGSGRPD